MRVAIARSNWPLIRKVVKQRRPHFSKIPLIALQNGTDSLMGEDLEYLPVVGGSSLIQLIRINFLANSTNLSHSLNFKWVRLTCFGRRLRMKRPVSLLTFTLKMLPNS